MATKETIKAIKAVSREIHKGMKRTQVVGTPKGAKGFRRHPKHRGKGWE